MRPDEPFIGAARIHADPNVRTIYVLERLETGPVRFPDQGHLAYGEVGPRHPNGLQAFECAGYAAHGQVIAVLEDSLLQRTPGGGDEADGHTECPA